MANNAYTFDFGGGRSAICTIKFAVDPLRWERLFSNIRTFAEFNNFDARVARLKPDADIVYIDLWKPDMAIAGENVFKPSEFALSFYIDPSKGGTRDAALVLAGQLRDELRQIPGVSAEVDISE